MRHTIHLLMIAAFVLAGISPACKFISGKAGFLEICTADGIERIAIADDLLPPDTPADKPDHQSTDNTCAFCFATSHSKPFAAAPTTIAFAPLHATTQLFALHAAVEGAKTFSPHTPRGPPSLHS